MEKLDWKQAEKQLYSAPAKTPELVEIPEMQFLMVDGEGDPNGSARYQDAVQALYSLSYALKFQVKKSQGLDYAVFPLEGLWWVEDLRQLSYEDRRNWRWTMMIRQPEAVHAELVEAMRTESMRKKGLAALEQLRLERFHEGLCAQVLHIGPYSAEPPTVERLHNFVEASGYRLRDKHHEIYLGDPNRTAPEKLKTILRHPVEHI